LVEAIKTAAEGGALLPDRGIEESVRAALGLPEMPEHESREEQEHRLINARPAEVKTEVEQIERTEVKSSEPAVTEITDDQADDTEREAKEMEALAESLRRPLAVSGRELREEERYVRLDETLAPMVGVKEAMAQAAEDWRELIAERYADRMAEAGDLIEMGDGEPLLLAPAGRKVEAEDPTAEGESVADEIDPEDAVENVARTSALAAADRVKAASITAVQSGSIGGVMATAAIAATVAGAVRELSPGADLVQAQRDTNTIFGLGRMQEARAQGAEEGIRSAMLESSTCDVCLSKDGSRFEMSELDEYATPDPDCFGGDQCNCIVIFIKT
jgi:hypothetical protein